MRINVFIDEIEFEGEGGGIEFSFHDKMRFKKAFEQELTKLFLKEKLTDKNQSFVRSIIEHEISFTEKKDSLFQSPQYLKEIDGGKLSIEFDKKINPHNVGKGLAISINSSLNSIYSSINSTSSSNSR
jgi:hypothetical protein